jgi:hypothetical protein
MGSKNCTSPFQEEGAKITILDTVHVVEYGYRYHGKRWLVALIFVPTLAFRIPSVLWNG